MNLKRPYIIIPKLIEQPTWGGTYILNLKNWTDKPFLSTKKIGQSYELFSGTKLLTHITATADPQFVPELGNPDTPDIDTDNFPYKKDIDYIDMQTYVNETGTEMPLLIKINQAAGNSFQLHVKPGTEDKRWLPKPESWYYFEDGKITCGIKEGISLEEYKEACLLINNTMKQLSHEVMSGNLSLDDAKTKAKEFIRNINPWQYVNVMDVKKGQLVDLSMGGVHHSWEEDKENHPLGNVVYEVQRDVMDPQCTIRSFDQGKFKSDGSIREIHIEDYFKYLDADPAANDINNLKRERVGNSLLKTPYYSMNIIECENTYTGKTNGTFCHLFVHQGDATITTTEGSVHITQGHSCFVPAAAESYTITTGIKTVLLQSFI